MASGVEKNLENTILEYLRARGFYCEKVHSGEMYVVRGPARYRVKLATKGTPDIFASIYGRFVAIEVKATPEEQEEWERQWEKHLDTKQFKKSWERSIFQHEQQEKVRAGNAAGKVIVCSSVDELHADIQELEREWGVGESAINRPSKLD